MSKNKQYIILPVIKHPAMSAFDMVYDAWRKAVQLQMIIQFEIEYSHITYRIYPNMTEKEISQMVNNATDLEELYNDKPK